MGREVTSLEKLLRVWELRAFARETRSLVQGLRPTGPDAHWAEFRQHLLESRSVNFDRLRFGGMEGVSAANDVIAESLFAWSRHGRRIFRLDEDLALQLLATDFTRLDWLEVQFPLPSFTIEWPSQSGANTVIFSHRAEGVPRLESGLSMVIFDARGEDGSSNAVRYANLKSAAARRDLNHFNQLIREMRGEFRMTVCSLNEERISSSIDEMEKALLERKVEEVPDSEDDRYERLGLKLAAGLALYLQSLSSRERAGLISVKKARNTVGWGKNTLTQETEVCEVKSAYRLSERERAALRGVSGNGDIPSPHIRHGHWRRRPGFGSDPDAPKVVHVRPTWIGAHRLGEDELPVGSVAKVR